MRRYFPPGIAAGIALLLLPGADLIRDPMEVVGGAMGSEKVHFEAPGARRLEMEMDLFFRWFEGKDKTDPVLRAAIAHLWFVTIHPFEDGNGRIARAIADMALARADGSRDRFLQPQHPN